MEPFSLAAPGIELSLLKESDIDQIFELCQDSEVQRWTTIPKPYSRLDAELLCRTTAPSGWQLGLATAWAIRPAGQPLAGIIRLMNQGKGSWEVGYWLGAQYRGKGLVNKALNVVLDAAFDPDGPIKAARIEWRCQIDNGVPNWASWRSAWRLGFHKLGIIRHDHENNGVRHDSWVADLLPDDPRTPTAPWDGPVRHGELSEFSQQLCPTDAVTVREGDCPEGLVARFQRLYGRPIAADAPSLRRTDLDLRMSLIAEEFGELVGSVYGAKARSIVDAATAEAAQADDATRDVVEAADALADMVYVIYGMALEMGIDLPAVLAEVQRSNMSKMGADGKPILREDGKVLKGPDYFPPDIAAVLARDGYK